MSGQHSLLNTMLDWLPEKVESSHSKLVRRHFKKCNGWQLSSSLTVHLHLWEDCKYKRQCQTDLGKVGKEEEDKGSDREETAKWTWSRPTEERVMALHLPRKAESGNSWPVDFALTVAYFEKNISDRVQKHIFIVIFKWICCVLDTCITVHLLS